MGISPSSLLNYLQNRALPELGGGRGQYGPYRARGPALFSYDLAKVFLGNGQLDYRGPLTYDLHDPNVFRTIHKSLCDQLDQLLHEIPPRVLWRGSGCSSAARQQRAVSGRCGDLLQEMLYGILRARALAKPEAH